MTTYNQLAGLRVNYLSTDPTLNSGNEGQVWYNSTTGTLRSLVQLKAWSAAANLPVARDASASDGTSIAGWIAGGSNTPAGNTGTTATEEYSGYTWASGGNLNTARTLTGGSGFGTQTAAAVAGGATQPGAGPTRTTLIATEEYNGSAWTSVTGLPTATFGAAQCGIQTAGLSFTGTAGYGNPTFNTSLEYDGTNWTSGGNVNTAVNYQAAGIQTAALAMQSSDTAGKGTEAYNGTSWTAVANRNTGRAQIVGFGTQALATIAGGYNAGPGTPQLTETEQWDGTAWSISTATLGTAARNGMGIGTVGGGTSGLYAGGVQTTYIANTQEFNSTIFSPATGAWASGGNLSTARAQLASANAGTQNAGLAFGGFQWPSSLYNVTEEYNGSSWSGGGNLGTARRGLGGSGTQTAGLAFGGYTSPPVPSGLQLITEEYDGSAWSSGGNSNTGGFLGGNGGGTQTSALKAGGGSAVSTQTEEYDGSTWTIGGTLNTARIDNALDGSQTAGITVGGEAPGGTTAAVESYDGSSWTSVTTSLIALQNQGKSGGLSAQTALMVAGGDGPTVSPATGITQEYDGTNWTTTATLGTARRQLTGGGIKTAGLVFGGTVASVTALTNTEEYTGAATTATASTLTTS
jgi:hypothetical protein